MYNALDYKNRSNKLTSINSKNFKIFQYNFTNNTIQVESKMNIQDMQGKYQSNLHMRSSTPEIRPRYNASSPISDEMYVRHTPVSNARSNYAKMSTPLHTCQRPQDIYLNRDCGYIPKPKAFTPPEKGYQYITSVRPNTPDGRYWRPNEREMQYSMNKLPQHTCNQEYRTFAYPPQPKSPEVVHISEDKKTIAMLVKQLQDVQRENGRLKTKMQRQKDCMETLYIENLQAKNLLEQETRENSWLTTQLARTRFELEGLRGKHLVTRRVALENGLGHIRESDIISPEHIPVIRGYNNKVEEMERKLREKDQELCTMKKACENERKQKQSFLEYYENILHLL